jgi:hypothetical protein
VCAAQKICAAHNRKLEMNSVSGTGTLSIKDPVTGEMHSIGRADLRGMVADIAKHAGPEFVHVPQEIHDLLDGEFNPDVLEALALKDEIAKLPRKEVLTVEAVPAQTFVVPNSAPNGLRKPNRKERRANEKRSRSKVLQKTREKELARVQKAMQAQIDERNAAEALQDVPFSDPRHVGKIVRVFEPIEKALQTFVDGEVAHLEDGTPLMWATEDGCWYPAVNCLRSVLETYAKLGDTHGWNNHNAGLARVATLLENGEPIHKSDVDEALKTIEWMKYCTLTITPRQFTKEAVEVQIYNELRDAKLAPEPTDADLTRDNVAHDF